MLAEMRNFLEMASRNGSLAIAEPGVAAEHFFCLLKGLVYMRVMMGLCEAAEQASAVETRHRSGGSVPARLSPGSPTAEGDFWHVLNRASARIITY